MKNIAVLGSSGSIGENTLAVVRSLPGKFRVVALSVNSDIESLYGQIKEFRPKLVCVNDKHCASRLKKRLNSGTKVLCQEEGLSQIVKDKSIELIMFAISGSAALAPLLEAIKSGKDIALANKEALVMAGGLIMSAAKRNKVKLLPVDSEQSAIWQSLKGEPASEVKTIYLTASGGPLKDLPYCKFKSVTLGEVLKHPRWKMGKKITVDSATLMNKGLELLEAMFLFAVPAQKIKILIHPQAIIHSMVEFNDAVVIAQLSATDMRIPIQYALTYPQRLANHSTRINFCRLGEVSFESPDFKRFPCLRLALEAARKLGTMPAVLNAANEVSVAGFLNKEINFVSIARVVERVMRKHRNLENPVLSEIIQADAWARQEASSEIRRLN